MSGASRVLRRRIFWRTLFLQACWNYERMQNVGFAWCMEPWLRRAYPEAAARQEALRRHLGFFNTQPHMAGFVVGVTGRLEEAAGRSPEQRARIDGLKRAMQTTLAGIGDAFFWGTLKPACAVAALAVGWAAKAAGAGPEIAIMAACVMYLALFNGPALWMRWNGIRLGYEWGEDIAVEMKRMHWQKGIRRLRAAGLALAAALAVGPLLNLSHSADYLRFYAAGLAICLAIKALRVRALPAYGLVLAASFFVAWAGK